MKFFTTVNDNESFFPQQSELYTEIKRDCGLPANNKIPSDIWSLENLIRYRENGVIGHPYGTLSSGHKRRIGNLYIPNEKAERLMSLESKIFISKFNRDGSHLITGSQGKMTLHLYNFCLESG